MSSAPLIFVRDGRTLPYFPVTVAALEAIREHIQKGRAYAIATYVALLEYANENRADRTAVTQRDLIKRAGVGRTTLQTALIALREAGVLEIHERVHAGARLENEYVLVEPHPNADGVESDTPARDTSNPPARQTGDPCPPGGQRTQENVQEGQKGAPERATKKIALPDGFPEDLLPHLRSVYRILRDFAARHNAREVNPTSLAHAVMAHPKRHYVSEAHRYASNWEDKQPKDCVAGYRRWLGNADKMAGIERLADDGTPADGLPEGVTPLHSRRRQPAGEQPAANTGDLGRFKDKF